MFKANKQSIFLALQNFKSSVLLIGFKGLQQSSKLPLIVQWKVDPKVCVKQVKHL